MSDGTIGFLLVIAFATILSIIYLAIGAIIARNIKDKVAFGEMFNKRYECDLFTAKYSCDEKFAHLNIIYLWWYIALELGSSFIKDLPNKISWKFERLLLRLSGKKI